MSQTISISFTGTRDSRHSDSRTMNHFSFIGVVGFVAVCVALCFGAGWPYRSVLIFVLGPILAFVSHGNRCTMICNKIHFQTCL